MTARSFSRGLVPGSGHSFVNFWASGAIEAPLESPAASGTCTCLSTLLMVPRCPPALFQDRPAGAEFLSSDGHAMHGRTNHANFTYFLLFRPIWNSPPGPQTINITLENEYIYTMGSALYATFTRNLYTQPLHATFTRNLYTQPSAMLN